MATKASKDAKVDAGCSVCSGSEHAKTPCLSGCGVHGGIMIVGDIPTVFEDMDASLFGGTVGKMLARELYTVGIDITQCYVTKAIKCHHGEKTPSRDTIRNCRAVLESEIEKVRPTHILLLGSLSLTVLMNMSNLMKNRGKLLDYKGIKVIATVSPAITIKQPHQLVEFRADLNYFSRLTEGWKEPDDFHWRFCTEPLSFEELKREVVASDAISYDIECTGLDEYEDGAQIIMIGIATRFGCHILGVNKTTIPLLIELIGDGGKWERVAHNAKFDNRWLRYYGIEPSVTYDTFLAAYLLNVNTPHGLKYLAKTYLGAIDYDTDIVFKKGLTEAEFNAMAKYCALDCYYTLRLYDFTKNELRANNLWRVFRYIVMPGERILQDIENRGVYIDKEKLAEVTSDYEMERDITDEKIEELLPERWKGNINLNSSKQLGALLFEDLGLPVISRTKTGEYSTGKSTLLRLVDKHPIPKLILVRRKYDKALVGFLMPWKEYLKRDGRLHSTYKIANTATGRLSAENPNLQQVPRDSNVRNLVGAPDNMVFIEADYSQIELRTAAFVADARSMKDCYIRGEDLHTKTAASVSHVPIDKVTKPQRTAAKAVNFGFLYGMWWKSFKEYAFDSYGVVVTDAEAEHARNVYFETYPELLLWHERERESVRKLKYVRTHTGRIRHLPNIDSPDKDLRGEAERQAINTKVQSFASDITLLAMILIDRNIKRLYKGRAFLVGQVHDAIMVEAEKEIGREVALMVKKCMESVPVVLEKYFGVRLDVPLVAEVEMGPRWGIAEIVEP